MSDNTQQKTKGKKNKTLLQVHEAGEVATDHFPSDDILVTRQYADPCKQADSSIYSREEAEKLRNRLNSMLEDD